MGLSKKKNILTIVSGFSSLITLQCCQKDRNGAMPVPGPINMIGFVFSGGRWKLDALKSFSIHLNIHKLLTKKKYQTFAKIRKLLRHLWLVPNNLSKPRSVRRRPHLRLCTWQRPQLNEFRFYFYAATRILNRNAAAVALNEQSILMPADDKMEILQTLQVNVAIASVANLHMLMVPY